MEVQITHDREAKLAEIANRTGRSTDDLLREAVDHLVEYNEWLEPKVQSSVEQAERGELLSTDQVRTRVAEALGKNHR